MTNTTTAPTRTLGGIDVPGLPLPTRRTWERQYVLLAIVLDATAAAVGAALAFAISSLADPASTSVYLMESVALPLLLIAAIALAGGYERRFLGIGPEEFRRVTLGILGLAAFVGFLSWATQAEVARTYVVVAVPVALGLTWAGRYGLRKWIHRQRAQGRFRSRTIIVGAPASAIALVKHLERAHYHGYEVVGLCPTSTEGLDAVRDLVVADCPQGVVEAVARLEVDTVAVLSGPTIDGETLRRLSWSLEPTGANLVVAPGLIEVTGPRMAVRPVDGLPLLHVEHPQFSGTRRLVKSVYEPVSAAVLLMLLLPLLAGIAIAIRLDSPGPILFRQRRVGRLGEEFTIYKFRTMVADADARKSEIAHLNEGAGPLFKARHDPRITRVGAFLRRTSLDELPQLLNVVFGQMALVGPRPHLPEELALVGEDFTRRLFVKPGLTGLWQVSGRSDLSFEESVRLDLRYVENWTLTLDIHILWKTLSVVLNRSGAY